MILLDDNIKNSDNLIKTPWFVIPYTSTTSDKFSSICKNENLNPSCIYLFFAS